MAEFLSEPEKHLHSQILPDVQIVGKRMNILGKSAELLAEAKDPNKVKGLLTALFIRGLTVQNMRELSGSVFDTSKLDAIGFGGVTVDDGKFMNTTLLSSDTLMKLFKFDVQGGQTKLEGDVQDLARQISGFLNELIKDYKPKVQPQPQSYTSTKKPA